MEDGFEPGDVLAVHVQKMRLFDLAGLFAQPELEQLLGEQAYRELAK